MSTKESPKKVTLAMLRGKPITTSVPVIHYHASDDELDEIYPSTDEDKRLTPEIESITKKTISTLSKSTHESDIPEYNADAKSASTENILLEGTPPSLAPWKVFTEIKGKITKTFEEKLSEIKSNKRSQSQSRAESSSISDLDDQGCATPYDENIENNGQGNELPVNIGHEKIYTTRYVGFHGIKTGLKDKNLQNESVESGIEAFEFSPSSWENETSQPEKDIDIEKVPSKDSCAMIPPKQVYTHLNVHSKEVNFKSIFLQAIQQFIFWSTCKWIAAIIGIYSICYIVPVPESFLGFILGVSMTVMLYDIVMKFKQILNTLPDDAQVCIPMIPVLEIPAIEEYAVVERFQGWVNELPYVYEPNNYHVARTKSVYLKLEGNVLHIMETRTNVPKRTVWDEPKHKLKFVKRRIYNLTGASVELVPYGLVRRRRWSKKYPICITLKKESLICKNALKHLSNNRCLMHSCHHKNVTNDDSTSEFSQECKEPRTKETQVRNDGICLTDSENEKSFTTQKQEKQDGVEGDRFEEEKYNTGDESDSENFNNYVWEYDSLIDGFGKCEKCLLEQTRQKEHSEDEEKKEFKEQQNENHGMETKNSKRGYIFINKQHKKRNNVSHQSKTDHLKLVMQRRTTKKENFEEEEQDKRKDKSQVSKERKTKENNKEPGDDIDKDEEEDDWHKQKSDDGTKVDYSESEEDELLQLELEDKELEETEEDDDKLKELEEDNNGMVMKDNIEITARENVTDNNNHDKQLEKKDKENEMQIKKKKKRRSQTTAFNKLKKDFKHGLKIDDERNVLKIFIFARADREKEDWYRRLVSATNRRFAKHDSIHFTVHGLSNTSSSVQVTTDKSANTEHKSSFSAGNMREMIPELSYNAYMAKFLGNTYSSTAKNTSSTSTDEYLPNLWINCIIARILFDVRKCPETISLIQDKIQRKLSNIKLPYFMECLLVSEIAIGQGAPVIHNVTKPVTNDRGLWFDLDLTYKGSLTMTVETKLNLMKLTRTGSVPSHSGDIFSTEKQELANRSAIFDSELEDTPETSTEEDYDTYKSQPSSINKETTSSQSSGRRFLSMVDRIAANKYFQHATELSYIRRAMEGVSNTEIRLMVTVSSLEGCLSINIPPPPADRLWYGFKPVPKVNITVKPAVGERAVNIIYITKWIEAKLLREFEKLVVLPNMDDLVVPLCPNYPYETIP